MELNVKANKYENIENILEFYLRLPPNNLHTDTFDSVLAASDINDLGHWEGHINNHGLMYGWTSSLN